MFDFDDLEDEQSASVPLPAAPAAPPLPYESVGRNAARRAAEGLASEDHGVRWDSCRELAKLGSWAVPYFDALERLISQEQSDDVRRAARRALRELRGDDGAVRPPQHVVDEVIAAQDRRIMSLAISVATSAGPGAWAPADDAELAHHPAVSSSAPAVLADRGFAARPLDWRAARDGKASWQTSQKPFTSLGSRQMSNFVAEAYTRNLGRGGVRAQRDDDDADEVSEKVGDSNGSATRHEPPEPEEVSWLAGREYNRAVPAASVEQGPLPDDPFRLNFLIPKSKTKFEVLSMRVDREGMTSSEVTGTWERDWGVQFAGMIRFENPDPQASSRWLNPRSDALPPSPAVIRLEASGAKGSILYTLSAALRQYGAMSVAEALEFRSRRQSQAADDARRRKEADAKERSRFLGLGSRRMDDDRPGARS